MCLKRCEIVKDGHPTAEAATVSINKRFNQLFSDSIFCSDCFNFAKIKTNIGTKVLFQANRQFLAPMPATGHEISSLVLLGLER